MALIEYTLDENVAVVTMNDNENVFNPPFLEAFLDVLDAVENETDARVIVVTSAHEKIFSNGIDLMWLAPFIQKGDAETPKKFFYTLNKVFRRIVTYPLLTIAAISGHAFAGGAIISTAFDFRFMRGQRGYFCLPEVDLGIPFLPGMNAMLKKAIPLYKLEEMQYTGARLTAEECEEHHIIKKALPLEDLLPKVLEFAKPLKKERIIIKELKARLNREIIHALDVEDPPHIDSGQFKIT